MTRDDEIRRLAKTYAEIRRLDELAPSMQHFISQVENGHVTQEAYLAKLTANQRAKYLSDQEFQKQNNANVEKLVRETKYGSSLLTSVTAAQPCPSTALVYDQTGFQRLLLCDQIRSHHVHFAQHHRKDGGSQRVTWTGRKAYFREDQNGSLRETKPGAIQIYETARVTKVEGTVQVPAHTQGPWDASGRHVPSCGCTSCSARRYRQQDSYNNFQDEYRSVLGELYGTPAAPAKMTREAYRTRFSEMEYTIVKHLTFGFIVMVTLAKGGMWRLWRPTRAWAERTGAKRLKRELARLDMIYDLDNPKGVRARDIGVHFQMTTEELTAELAKREAEEKTTEMAKWDEAFGDGKAS